MTRPCCVIAPVACISLEEPLRRRPWLRRPDGWRPCWGERVWFARGGDHRLEIVRVGFGGTGDCFPIAVRAGTHGARLHGTASLSRLWPLPGWEAERERFDREVSDEPNNELTHPEPKP